MWIRLTGLMVSKALGHTSPGELDLLRPPATFKFLDCQSYPSLKRRLSLCLTRGQTCWDYCKSSCPYAAIAIIGMYHIFVMLQGIMMICRLCQASRIFVRLPLGPLK